MKTTKQEHNHNGKKIKYRHSRYCEFYAGCDKPIDCAKSDFCQAFRHTTKFSSLRDR
jgi:hypothetical protein